MSEAVQLDLVVVPEYGVGWVQGLGWVQVLCPGSGLMPRPEPEQRVALSGPERGLA